MTGNWNRVRASGLFRWREVGQNPFNWPTWPTHSLTKNRLSRLESGGREGIRTPGLLVANEALSQLSYSPTSSQSILTKQKSVANTRSRASRACKHKSRKSSRLYVELRVVADNVFTKVHRTELQPLF